MRALWTAMMAASVFTVGLGTDPAQSLPLGARIAAPHAMVQQVQRGERGGGEFGYRERRERGYRGRGRDRDRGGFYFGFGPGGPSFGYGPQRRGRGYYDGYRGRGYYDGYRRRRDF